MGRVQARQGLCDLHEECALGQNEHVLGAQAHSLFILPLIPFLTLAGLHSCASPVSFHSARAQARFLIILPLIPSLPLPRCTRAEQPPIAGFLGWMAMGMDMHPSQGHQAQDAGLEGGSCRRLRFPRPHVRGRLEARCPKGKMTEYAGYRKDDDLR